MKQAIVNGIFVNALDGYDSEVKISFNEAQRLLVNVKPDFVIHILTYSQILNLANLEEFRGMKNIEYVIRNVNIEAIKDIDDLEFELHEVGYDCINSIRAELIRIGRTVDFEELDTRFRSGPFSGCIPDIYLQNNEVVVNRHSDIRGLSFFLNDDTITVNELSSILIDLKNIKISDRKIVES